MLKLSTWVCHLATNLHESRRLATQRFSDSVRARKFRKKVTLGILHFETSQRTLSRSHFSRGGFWPRARNWKTFEWGTPLSPWRMGAVRPLARHPHPCTNPYELLNSSHIFPFFPLGYFPASGGWGLSGFPGILESGAPGPASQPASQPAQPARQAPPSYRLSPNP